MRKILAFVLIVPFLIALAGLPASGTLTMAGSTRAPHSQALLGPTRIGPLADGFPLEITLELRGQNPAGLSALLAAIADARSPLYHHFLSPAEFARRFGPSTTATAHVEQALRMDGLRVGDGDAASALLTARGSVAVVEALFGVRLDEYRDRDGERYYAPRSAPRLPRALAPYVSGVLGLDSRSRMRSHPLIAPRANQESSVSGLSPDDLARAYHLGPLQSSGLDGTGQTIALAEIDTFRPSDISAYDQQFGISAPPAQTIKVAGGARARDPETALDIEVAHAIAPHATILVYESRADLAHLARMFSQIVTDHKARIVSISLGACEIGINGADGQSFINSLDSTFQRADAEGISVLVASGDSGAYGCQDTSLSVALPASSPYVTAVGGTALFLNGNGSYRDEAGWEGPLEGAGSGGGLSQIYTRPSWQGGSGVSNSFSNGMRQVPDVAADADPLTGYLIYYSGWQVVGGTSAAAPLWAGLIALGDQLASGSGKPPLGFLNPRLYSLAGSASGGAPFHDVALGGNLYYDATPGWDYATGWGTPDAAVLVRTLVG